MVYSTYENGYLRALVYSTYNVGNRDVIIAEIRAFVTPSVINEVKLLRFE